MVDQSALLDRERLPAAGSGFALLTWSFPSGILTAVAAVYRITDKGITPVKGAGGGSPKDADETFRNIEAVFAQGWYDSTVADMFH